MSRGTARDSDLFGHPRGLTYLFTVEMWERFSYYGMKALLVLYMVKHLLQPGRAENVVGLAALKSALETVFGPLDVQPFSSHIYGLYTGLVYFTPVLGGIVADRWLGQRRTVVLGAALMAFGHFLMAFESLFLLAITVLILGNGAFKPNVSTQVGSLYPKGDPRRDGAFTIFYMGINLGAFFSPIVCGTLGEKVGWHYGFSAAGVGMVVGLLVFLWGQRHFGTVGLPPARDGEEELNGSDDEHRVDQEIGKSWSIDPHRNIRVCHSAALNEAWLEPVDDGASALQVSQLSIHRCVHNCDKVRIDIGRRTANIKISKAELARRKAAWKPSIKPSQTPWQELQRKYVGQLSSGACLDFAVDFQRVAQTKGVPRHSH